MYFNKLKITHKKKPLKKQKYHLYYPKPISIFISLLNYIHRLI